MKTLVQLFAIALLSGVPSAVAQTTTGTIIGSVTDPSGLAVASAGVTLTQTTTGVQIKTQTMSTGDFVFNAIEPGRYDITVEAPGFKKAQRTAINLTANDRLPVGTIALEVGNVSESVTVKAQGAEVQTASSEHSGVLTSSQVDNLLIKGRNTITLLQLLPGVVDTNAPDAPDRNFAIGLSVNGNRRNAVATWMDGVATQDSGVGWIATANISMDAVAEVKVLLNNYQAEYGRSRGAGVQLIGKSGTRDLHGSFSYFKRHEQFNANNFFNNRLGLPIPRYRYNTYSYTIGGPLFIPRRFNKERNKLFFFWSQEFWPQKTDSGLTQVNMPSALERMGDFSQTVDQNGKLITVKDPLTGQAFPGNVVPRTRIDPSGQALLNFLPLPNFLNRGISGGQYNYVFDGELDKPQHLQTAKIDYDPNSTNLVSFTWSRQEDLQTGTRGLATPNANWPEELRTFVTRGNIMSGRYQKIISPTLVNEFVFGYNWRNEHETVPPDQLTKLENATVGFNITQLFPTANPLGLLPNVTFGGIPNPANITLTGIPEGGLYKTFNVADNITKTLRSHILKAGVFFNRPSIISVASANPGTYNFSTDVNNPLETGYTYANALLGVFASHTEANRVVQASSIYKAFEWFVQDSWKVSRTLTLELGLRFMYSPPGYSPHVEGMFSPAAFNPAQAPQLIRPTIANGVRSGINPVNGQIYPAVAIGSIAPGSGVYGDGVILSSMPGVPRGLVKGPGIAYDPRFGFAWDPFGDGKTAVRGGFGIFQSEGATGEGKAGSETVIPLVQNFNIPYSTLSALKTSPGLLSPASVSTRQNPQGIAASYNISFQVQRNIGFNTVVEVGYVGTLGRHLNWGFDLDPVPLGANFDPRNIDPTTGRPLPANFLRPIPSYSGMTLINWGATSNYHSLQSQVTRRFTRSLQFGVSYTWSKFLDSVDFDANVVSPFVPARHYNYGPSTYDRRHNLRMNWLYDLPQVPWKDVASRWILNGWQFSGINAFISGTPTGVGFTTTNNADITGTTSQGPRIDVTCNPVLPKSDRTFSSFFNTSCFALPAVGTLGNAGRTLLVGPGTNNWDLSFFKNFPIREPLKLQFRAEMYNAFNHTQFSSVDTTARFDPTGKQVNPTFGQYTAARNARQIQFGAKISF